jgi:hypothetical protein
VAFLAICVQFCVVACDSPSSLTQGAGGANSLNSTGGAATGGTTQYLGYPSVTLLPSTRYPTRDHIAQPQLMRNIAANSVAEAIQLLDLAQASGTHLARMQLTQGFGYATLGITSNGNVVESLASEWDNVIDAAADRGIAVIPVFAIWGDWNDGTPNYNWSHWSANPLNSINGGPATDPSELLTDTFTQQRWLAWLTKLVTRWQSRANVFAWEAFSEIDLMTGVTEAAATAFAVKAADSIRAADSYRRPVMTSTSDLNPWTALWASSGNDIVQLHPYGTNLDELILQRVPARLAIGKPVIIGESGLDAASPDGTTVISTNPNANVGLRHAIWAGIVSGAGNARAFYWEDAYAVFYPATGMSLVNQYATLETPASTFLGNKDFTGLVPASATYPSSLFGATLASQDQAIGWFRDALCVDPWSCTASVSSTDISVVLGASFDSSWVVRFFDPTSGELLQSAPANVVNGTLSFTLPPFTDSIVFWAAQ